MCLALRRLIALVVAVAFLSPALAAAQAPRAGIVTTLEGNVTARRIALPDPVPLKFKDEVFLQDTVTTGDRSLARMLLGGKAVVTVRERTVLTITEIPGKSTIDVQSGKFALAVAREKMRPGEEIQIRTPNAVAAVRGTVVVTEVTRQGAQAGSGNPAVLTSFYVLRGTIVAQQLDALTRQPVGAPLQVGTLHSYSQAGAAIGRVLPVPKEQVGQITSGLQPSGPKGGGDAGQEQVKSQAVQTAVTLLTALTGGGDSQQAFLLAPSGPKAISLPISQIAPVLPPVGQKIAETKKQEEKPQTVQNPPQQEPSGPQTVQNPPQQEPPSSQPPESQPTTPTPPTTPPPPPPPPPPPFGPRVLSGTINRAETTPLVEVDTQTVQITDGLPLITVAPGADVTLASKLASVHESTITGNAGGIDIRGKIRSTHTGALIDLDPTIVGVQGNLLSVIGEGAELTLAGPLLNDVGGLLVNGGTTARSFLAVLDGGRVTDTSLDPFISLTSSTVISEGSFFSLRRAGEISSRVDLAGPFLSASGANIVGFSTTLQDQSGAPRLCCSFFAVGQGGVFTSTTTLPLVSLAESVLTFGQHVFVVFDTTSIFGESTITMPGTVTLAGPLVKTSGETRITGLSDFLGIFRSALSSTTTAPLITLEDSTVAMGVNPLNETTGPGRLLNLSANASLPATLALEGPLLNATNSTITTTDDVFGVFNGASLTSTTTSPLITVDGGSITAGRDGSFFVASSSIDAGPAITLGGPLLTATGTTLKNGLPHTAGENNAPSFIAFRDGAQVIGTTTAPFVSLSGTVVDTAGNFFDVRRNEASVFLAGPLLDAVNGSTIDVSSLAFGSACCNVVRLAQGATVLSSSTAPFINLVASTMNAGPDPDSGGDIVRIADVGSLAGDVPAAAQMALAGPLIKAQGSILTSLFHTLSVERSALSSSTPDPLIELTSSSLSAGGANPFTDEQEHGRLALVIASPTSGGLAEPAAIGLAGSLLSATDSTVDTVGDLIGVFNGGQLSTRGTTPLVMLSGTDLTVGRPNEPGALINIQGVRATDQGDDEPSVAVVSAGLLSVSGGVSTLTGGIVRAGNGGQLVSEHPTQPLVSIAGGTHDIASAVGQAALNLVGRPGNVDIDEESGLQAIGTDQPLRHTGSGPFIALSGGATVTAQTIASLDTALLEASAPLLHITGATTSMTAAAGGLDLVQKAKLTTSGSLFQVNGGTLTFNADAVRVMNGSFLRIGGDLFHITNGGIVNISNGAAIFANGGSVVTISGSLVNFANNTGTFTLNNALCSAGGCVPVGGGINVLAKDGATVTVSNPITGTGTLNIGPNAAAILATGANTKVTVGSPGGGL